MSDPIAFALEQSERRAEIERKQLLAKMAASIAAGIESNPSCDGFDPDDVANRAHAVAEEILKIVGLR